MGPIGAWAVSMELPGKGLELDLEGMMMGDVWGLWLVESPVKKISIGYKIPWTFDVNYAAL